VADTKDLSLILDAKIPIVVVESHDERRVLAMLLRFAMQRQLAFYEWRVTRGLHLGGFGTEVTDNDALREPEALLRHIATAAGPALYVLCDFHPYLANEPTNIRYLKDIALDHERLGNTLVMLSHELPVPVELGRLTAKFDLRLPSDEELMALIRAQAKAWAEQHRGQKVRTDNDTLKRLIANLRGVSHADAQVLIRHAIYGDGAITDSDIPEVNRLKFELLDSEGVLRFEYDTENFGAVAGLDNLKQWLELRRNAFLTSSEDQPKGIMLLGVQGGGKSLAAKAVAGYWGIPLLRLDFGTLYNKFFGETERNLRNSLKQAELMAPCVLWMDEIEKGLATGQSDNATSKRVLSTLLTWMTFIPVIGAAAISILPAKARDLHRWVYRRRYRSGRAGSDLQHHRRQWGRGLRHRRQYRCDHRGRQHQPGPGDHRQLQPDRGGIRRHQHRYGHHHGQCGRCQRVYPGGQRRHRGHRRRCGQRYGRAHRGRLRSGCDGNTDILYHCR